MVDFSALPKVSPEERMARDAARREEGFRRDEESRDAASKKALSITLVQEPEMRSLPSGEAVVVLRGTEKGALRPLVAVYKIPDRVMANEETHASFMRSMQEIGGGDKMSLAGSWTQRHWKTQQGEMMKAWEFKAQHIAVGEVPLERMLSKSRGEEAGRPVGIAAQAAMSACGASMGG